LRDVWVLPRRFRNWRTRGLQEVLAFAWLGHPDFIFFTPVARLFVHEPEEWAILISHETLHHVIYAEKSKKASLMLDDFASCYDWFDSSGFLDERHFGRLLSEFAEK
jgi:hypothetical protein